MPDLRLSWASKFRYVSPADFQAAQLSPQQEKRNGDGANKRPAKRQRRRRKYTPEDFQTPFATPREIREWWERYPALHKRNFYVVQNHYATADHFDLRLQLDGRTTSWAIPKTLADPSAYTERQAIETSPHSISYTLLEGAVASGMSTTGVWDLGTYTICDTKSRTTKRERARAQGFEDCETTDEDDASLQPEDERQEDLFRDAFHYVTFQATPAVEGRAGQPAKKDNGRPRGFVVELNGERYKGLRLTFKRPSNDVQLKRNTRSSAKPGAQQETVRLYSVTLSSRSEHSLSDTEAPPHIIHPDRSLLTNRTMAEIRKDGIQWLSSLMRADEEDGKGDASTGTAEERRVGKGVTRLLVKGDDRQRGRRNSRKDGRELAEEVQRMLEAADEHEVGVLSRGDGGETKVLKDRAMDIAVNGFRN